MTQLADSISGLNVEDLSFQCGRDFGPLRSSLDTMLHILTSLQQSAQQGLGILSCERIVPIYTDVVYEGTCDTSVTGLAWIFSSLLIIATTGMIMITLRASYKNSVIVEKDDTDEDSEVNAMRKLANKKKHDQHQQHHIFGRSHNHHNHDDDDLALHHEERNVDPFSLEQEWTRQQTTSDTESVYTNRNGEIEYDHDGVSHANDDTHFPGHGGVYPPSAPRNDDVYYYGEQHDPYDDIPPRPSAPRESQLYY